jgi:PAS domain S-box-containing protein
MSLRKRTLVLMLATSLVAIVFFYGVSRAILINSFVQLEEQNAHDNLNRVVNAINDELAALEGTSGDWSNWDDTYFFVRDGSDEYVDTNLTDETFYNLNLNLMVLVNSSGERVYERAFDLENGTNLSIPSDLTRALAPDSPLLALGDENRAITGILMLDGMPALVAARPILTSEVEGPAAGTLMFARYLDSAKIARLSESTRLSLSLTPYDSPDLTADLEAAKAAFTADVTETVRPLDGTTIAGYALLNDVYGSPAVMLRAEMPRDITRQGYSTLNYFIAAISVIGVVFGGLSIYMLERVVLSRVAQLSSSVGTIRGSGDPEERVSVSGSDELARLGDAINAMLASLAASQKTVRASERQLQTVVNNAPITLWALDKDGEMTLLRGRGLETLGLRQSGTGAQMDSGVYLSLRPLIENSRKALHGEETAAILRVGDQVFDTRCAPLRGDQGEIVGVIGIATDITEQKKAETALQEALERVEKQNQDIARVHEFFRATLEQMTSTVKLGATRGELLNYLHAIQAQFDHIHGVKQSETEQEPEKPIPDP